MLDPAPFALFNPDRVPFAAVRRIIPGVVDRANAALSVPGL